MAWNEPGGGKDKDPWSGKGGDQGPPDLDEVVKNLQNKLGGLFGSKGRRGGGGPVEPGDSSPLKIPVPLILLVVAAFFAFNAFYIVEPAERGVIQRLGAYHSVTMPGPHLLFPFLDKVTVVNVDQVNKFAHRAQMLTTDENIVDITLTVQYRIQDAADYLFQDATPEATIHGAMESALREVIGKSKLDEIITENRSSISEMVKQGTQNLLDLYRTGLLVTNINIQEATPPAEVKAAFDDATKALADKERVQNQAEAYANDIVPRARGAGARLVEDAKAYKAKVVSEAEGESKRFLALLAEYQRAPAVTRERLYLETVQDVLQKSGKVLLDNKGGNLTYLPLDKLLAKGGNQEKPATPNELPGYDSLEAEANRRAEAESAQQAADAARSRRAR